MTLTSLRAAFDADRARVLAAAQPFESTPRNVCRYCGKFRNYSATKLDGHARCYVSLEFMRMVDAALQPADVTVRAIAELLGVPKTAIDIWCRTAQRKPEVKRRRTRRERGKRTVAVGGETYDRVADAARRRDQHGRGGRQGHGRSWEMKRRDYFVTVCAACRTASCWHGEFMCFSSGSAGVVDVPVSELRGEGREHPSNFSVAKLREVCGGVRYVP